MNGLDHLGRTALHTASQEKSVDVVSFLLESNADVNAETQDGDTPLFPGFEPNLEKLGMGWDVFAGEYHNPSTYNVSWGCHRIGWTLYKNNFMVSTGWFLQIFL